MIDRTAGRTFRYTVAGTEVETRLNLGLLDKGTDLSEEAGTIASTMGLVANLLGITGETLDLADSEYRSWRATFAKVIDDKLPEWKVRNRTESDPKFLEHKRKIARLEGDLAFLRAFLDALEAKTRTVHDRTTLTVKTIDGVSMGPDLRDRPSPLQAERDVIGGPEEGSERRVPAGAGSTRADRIRASMGRPTTRQESRS